MPEHTPAAKQSRCSLLYQYQSSGVRTGFFLLSFYKLVFFQTRLSTVTRQFQVAVCHLFRRHLHFLSHPPLHCFRKAPHQVIHGKIPRDILPDAFGILFKHGDQIFLEKPHEEFSAVAGQNAQDITLIIFQMIEQMRDLFLQTVVGSREIMGCLRMKLMGKNMVKNIGAHCLQQGVLGLEVGIESASADICLIQYLLDSNIVEMLFLQQPVKGLKDRSSCLLLSPIHVLLLQINLTRTAADILKRTPAAYIEQIAGIVQ